MVRNATFWDKFWRDEYGRDVIWQKPNVFLVTWFVSTFLTWFMPYNTLKRILLLVSLVAIIIWSCLEMYSGVNRFRRLLGLLVFIIVVINWVW
jgi:hypothetical protein